MKNSIIKNKIKRSENTTIDILIKYWKFRNKNYK